jgi:hypothetical protein
MHAPYSLMQAAAAVGTHLWNITCEALRRALERLPSDEELQ